MKTGIAAAAATGLAAQVRADPPDKKQPKGKKDKPGKPGKNGILPTRVLGRTGEKVTILNYGAGPHDVKSPRLLNAMYDAGIRCLDTADCYVNGQHEKAVGEWMADKGNRKEMFVVNKDHPKVPDEFVKMLDTRLAALQTDYIDLFFVHGVGEPEAGHKIKLDEMIELPKSKEWARAAKKIKKSGKARFVGFSMHGEMPARLDILKNAVAGGWVDAIMLMYDPLLVRENAEFNKALDACHKAGIGLISMKQLRRLSEAKETEQREEYVTKVLPRFKDMGLTPHQAVMQAVWTDERIATICSAIKNQQILKENSEAARDFKPLDEKKLGAVLELYSHYGQRYCLGCDGRCHRAAGTTAALNRIVRYLSYYEVDGCRDVARGLFAALTPEQRNWRDADLAAASQACLCKLDFASLLERAETRLA